MERLEDLVFCTLPRKCPITTIEKLKTLRDTHSEITLEVAIDRKTARKLGFSCTEQERINLECRITVVITSINDEDKSSGPYEVRVRINSDTLIFPENEEKGKDAPRRLGTYTGEYMPGRDAYLSVGLRHCSEDLTWATA